MPPSLPDTDPRAGRPRRGGRKSNFLAVTAEDRTAFPATVRALEPEVRQELGHPADSPLNRAAQASVNRIGVLRATFGAQLSCYPEAANSSIEKIAGKHKD